MTVTDSGDEAAVEATGAVTISVIIPVLDDAEYLKVALAALAQQTRPADEIIVVDNGSSDGSADLAIAAGAKVVAEPTQGILRATAAGFDAAVGTVLARIDADSIPPIDWLQRIHARFTQPNPPTGLTGPGSFYEISNAGAWAAQKFYLGGYQFWLPLLLGHPPLFGSNMALSRSAWVRIREDIHRADRRVHDDLDISFQLQADMTVLFDPALVMPVSGRPFHRFSGLARRIGWGFRTIAVNIRRHRPLRRRSQRRRQQTLRRFPNQRN